MDWCHIAGSSMFARFFFWAWAVFRCAKGLSVLLSTKPSLPVVAFKFSFGQIFFNTCELAQRASMHLRMLLPKGQRRDQEPYQHIIFRASEVKDISVDEPAPLRSVHGDPAVLGVRHYFMLAYFYTHMIQ